jgi:hypothetical protein
MDEHGRDEIGRSRSQLFTLRVWYEEPLPGLRELRLQVKHVLSGETRYFREWPACNAFMSRDFGTSSHLPS